MHTISTHFLLFDVWTDSLFKVKFAYSLDWNSNVKIIRNWYNVMKFLFIRSFLGHWFLFNIHHRWPTLIRTNIPTPVFKFIQIGIRNIYGFISTKFIWLLLHSIVINCAILINDEIKRKFVHFILYIEWTRFKNLAFVHGIYSTSQKIIVFIKYFGHRLVQQRFNQKTSSNRLWHNRNSFQKHRN